MQRDEAELLKIQQNLNDLLIAAKSVELPPSSFSKTLKEELHAQGTKVSTTTSAMRAGSDDVSILAGNVNLKDVKSKDEFVAQKRNGTSQPTNGFGLLFDRNSGEGTAKDPDKAQRTAKVFK